MKARSWVGLAIPRVAANASAISSSVKNGGAPVHEVDVRADREDEHHVAEVHRLSPRRRLHLDEEDIDQQQVAVPHHQVRGLDVTMGQTCVPQPADHRQPFVDDAFIDVGIPDLLGTLEELHEDHVLALGLDLDDAARRRHGEALVAEQAQRVVLVLHEAPDGLEPGLVLEGAVQDGSRQLVPTVGAHVTLRVELREEIRVRVALDLQPERCRASRPGEPDRIDLQHREPELLSDRLIASPRRPVTSRCAVLPFR